MTPQEINIAIAEWCGWKVIGYCLQTRMGSPPNADNVEPIPDFYCDPNAVHVAFELLENTQQSKFAEELSYILGIDKWTNCKLIIRATESATAPQRCEALLRTVGLWKEGGK